MPPWVNYLSQLEAGSRTDAEKTLKHIRKHFRTLALKLLHPDKPSGDGRLFKEALRQKEAFESCLNLNQQYTACRPTGWDGEVEGEEESENEDENGNDDAGGGGLHSRKAGQEGHRQGHSERQAARHQTGQTDISTKMVDALRRVPWPENGILQFGWKNQDDSFGKDAGVDTWWHIAGLAARLFHEHLIEVPNWTYSILTCATDASKPAIGSTCVPPTAIRNTIT